MTLVSCVSTDDIAQVRLNRPDKLNALTLDLLDELAATAHRLRGDRSLRAVVLAGEGESFCAGLDFRSVLGQPTKMIAGFTPRPWRGTNTFQEACWAWRRLPVPVIAAVEGHCLGGGLQIALAADFRFATPESTWSVLEGKWGIIPDRTGVRTLAELTSIDTAKRLTMTAEMLTGKQAHDLGLVSELDSDPIAAATAFAESLAQRSPDQLAAAKSLFNRTWTASPRRTFARERLAQAMLLIRHNTKIAQRAAFEKATPVYGPRAR